MADMNTAFAQAVEATNAEQSKDQAVSGPDQAERAPQTEEKGSDAALSTEASGLLSQEELDNWNKLKDPAEKLKVLNQTFTHKTQQLAEERKSLESFRQLSDRFEEDPGSVLRELAPKYGLSISEAVKEARQAETQQEVQAVADNATKLLRDALGPELAFIADRMGPVLEKLIVKGAQDVASKELEPIKAQQEQAKLESVTKSVDADIAQLAAKHPDWEKHWDKMRGFSQQLQPSGNMTGVDYLETLYFLATKDTNKAEQTKEIVKRMNESATKSDSSDSGMSTSRVSVTAPKFTNENDRFKWASDLAKAGTSVER